MGVRHNLLCAMTRPSWLLLACCTLFTAGCGTMRTNYEFPRSATVAQERQAMLAVDATAQRLGFTMDTQETLRQRNQGAHSYRRYYKAGLVLHAEIIAQGAYVDLTRGGMIRTRSFIATEAELTACLRRINAEVRIISWHAVNPMM